jgi:RNA polymerase sigma factor (sigma-70 family)
MSSHNFAEQEDETLVERYRSGREREAMDELWRRHEGRIRRSCRRVLRSETAAEDVTQDTFVKALLHLDEYTPGNFSGWLWRIAHRLCLNHLRSAAVRHETAWTPEAERGMSVSGDGLDRGQGERLLGLLEGLPERQRIVLKLLYLEEYSYEQIASLTGFSGQEVKSLIQNGRRMLRKKALDAGA